VQLLVPLGLLSALGLSLVGMTATSFTLHVRGLVGVALQSHASTDWSVVSLSTEIGHITELAPPVILFCLQFIFVLTCCALPLCWPLLCLAIWTLPTSPRRLRSLLVACEVLYAWSCLDVFVVILAASLLELDQVAKFSIGKECDAINQVLAQYPRLGGLLPGEPSCFGVAPTLDAGYWLMLAGVIISILAGGFVVRSAHCALAASNPSKYR